MARRGRCPSGSGSSRYRTGTAGLPQLTEEEKPLSRAMMDYWADFARRNPNH